jgi:hypothetical protein
LFELAGVYFGEEETFLLAKALQVMFDLWDLSPKWLVFLLFTAETYGGEKTETNQVLGKDLGFQA